MDVKKGGIEVFTKIIDNSYPQAFCVINENKFFPNKGLVLHTDGVGSKPVQSYLNWKESGDFKFFKGLAQDVVAMNIDDIVCVGAYPTNFVDYIALNPFKIPKKNLLKNLSYGFTECFNLLKKYGVNLQFSGGETADLPDTIRTLDLSGSALGLVDLDKVIAGEKIVEGDIIIGLRSGGKTKYEKHLNSGIMCNGITLARHSLIKKECVKKYPEILNSDASQYTGKFFPDQYMEELKMTIGEAITCPTRLFTPIITKVLEKYQQYVKGLVHNTGGGQTKCLRIGKGVHYVKKKFVVDPIFLLIQKFSSEDWRSMFENYNMGIGFEIIIDKEVAEEVLSICNSFGLDAEIIGQCKKSKGKNQLTIISPWGKFQFP